MFANALNYIKAIPNNIFTAFKRKPIAEIYLYIIAALYPILPSYFVLLGARVYTFLAIGCLLLLITTPQIKSLKLSGPKIIIVSIIGITLIIPSIINNEISTTGFLSYISNYLIIPIYFAVLVDSKEKFDRCINILLISAAIIGAFSLLEQVGFNVFSLLETQKMVGVGSSSGDRFGIYRAESSFGQPISYGIYLTFIVCLVYYKLFKAENQTRFKQNFYLITLFYFNVLVFLTVSRMPIVVAIVANIVLFFKLCKRSKIKVGIALGVIAIGTVIIAIAKGGSSSFITLFENIFQIFTGTTQSKSANPFYFRLSLYSYSKKVIGNDIFFGRGLHTNQIFFVYNEYGGFFRHMSFDNGYLSVYVNQGIFGIFSWVAFCYFTIVAIIFSYNKENSYICLPFVVLIAVYLLNMFSVARLDESRAFVVIIGCFLGMHHYVFDNQPQTKKVTQTA